MIKFLHRILLFLLPIGIAFAVDPPENNQLLVKRTYGGLRPPQFAGWEEKVTVSTDGSVIKSIRNNFSSPWSHVTIIHLSSNKITELRNLVAGLQPGELTFPNEDGCTDTPITSYSAKNRNGILVKFAERSRCLDGRLESFPSSEMLEEMLDSFRAP